MKIKRKRVIRNFLTLGFTGVRDSSSRVKDFEKIRKIPLSCELLNLILLVPILGGLTVGANVIFETVKLIGGHGTFEALFRGTIPYFFYCFGAFTFLHILLALSMLQSTFGLTLKEKIWISIFGGYAMDWSYTEHIIPTAEPDSDGNTKKPSNVKRKS